MKKLRLIVIVVIAMLALGVLASAVSNGLADLGQAEAERARLEAEKGELQVAIRELQDTLGSLRGDPRAVEALARMDLGWVRPGEVVVLVATPVPQPPPSLTGPAPTPILSLRD